MKIIGVLLVILAVILAALKFTGIIATVVGFGTIGSWLSIIITGVVGIGILVNSGESEGAPN